MGYILVSATKNYYPIFAYVDRGHFDETVYASGVSVLIDNYKKNINYWNTKQPVDSTERMKKLWRKYEKLSFDFNKSTRSESDLRGDQVLEWSVAGKLVHNMVDVAMLLPADVYQTFCNTAMIECNPEYDYLENSVVVEYTISPDFSYLIQSKWNQYAPYNYLCPMKNGKPILVGCSAVAVGQIMKYHQWPRNISWNLMPNSLTASGISELSDFLYEVGEAMNTSYGNIASSVTESSIVLALVEYGYNNDYANFYNESDVRASLLNNRPVLMLGQKDLNNDVPFPINRTVLN